MMVDEVVERPVALGPTLSEDEVIDASGGYRKAKCQLRELHQRGFWRAYRSTLTGKVVLERPHFDAVSRGGESTPKDTSAPKLRKPAKKTAVPA